ncbi:3-hydroxyacyl-CoA dehydrogenase [Natrialba magadii ATCC 43099]|uniref:3-hydroxyacyl-CoA dehydrogenase n=1 Tax=Natrialba magadii (strain ATCC 43099 / DSM 3394 / CCM 3739 / CIP 104546 / IAM 13178 / JCM 8861 / NBRC 102185 / NCIMB 2190 / MS3) TaxID=547559 RepID=D3T0H2_NATMM|nr:3-hydroxyacyl-CoA dehydrogenase family protein [Natrialba magadii]ADD06451.1 3-hydroxyacyl-CoA dehydrogenase [Natrialba magadii ATCC 43099]ELY31662.1 3-hydroxybutyryl-CoA dehydrogenase [Natrialba magadii ATCC 43099]
MQVTVLGAGSMGHGIAQVSAMAGYDVVLRDIEDDLVEKGLEGIRENLQGGVDRDKLTEDEMDATLERIEGMTDLADAVVDADLVIEAVPEDMDLKKDVLSDVEAETGDETVIASNTSSLSVTEMASALESPERVVGLHFFNPPHLMDLVEIVIAEQTDDRTEEFAVEYVREIEKEDVVVRDSAGFATSRLGLVTGLEAIRMVEEGVASPADIDEAMKLGYGYPMGPIELGDHVGLDVRLHIAEHLREELGERFKPPQALRRKVRAGNLGRKSGEGFYVWEDGERVGMSGEWGEDE